MFENMTDDQIMHRATELMIARTLLVMEDCKQTGRVHMTYAYYPMLKNKVACTIRKDRGDFMLTICAENEDYGLSISNFLSMGSEEKVKQYLNDKKSVEEIMETAIHLSEKLDKKIEDMD